MPIIQHLGTAIDSGGSGGGGSGIVTTNLVLHLDASNSSSYSGSGTTWSDISGNGNNLTLTNGPTYTSDNGGAIVFDGTNDYAISAQDASFFKFGTGDYSYGVWIKVDISNNINKAFLSSSNINGGPTPNAWQFDFNGTNGAISHVVRNASGSQYRSNTDEILNSSWHYVFFVNDRSEDEVKIYVDGSLADQGSNSWSDSNYGSINVGNNFGTTGTFRVGTNRHISGYLNGTIAQVHVYKGKALTASEVLQNYNATKSTYGH